MSVLGATLVAPSPRLRGEGESERRGGEDNDAVDVCTIVGARTVVGKSPRPLPPARSPQTGRGGRHRADAARAGFTLMEMLVVLAIIALVAGMSSQLVRPASPKLRVEAAARALCSAARATRVRAVATNQEMSLFVDVAHKTFRSAVIAETTMPNDARVDLTVAGGQRQGREGGAIVFFPGGGSTGGDVSIDLAGHRAHIGVNWLTGATTCDLG
jgi:general secretion pathway protein H